ncbi:MAG: hypothetical protein GWN01_10935 [Nitrosopumilaceae archaeon]|nr:hypothetical protein [Nitrosopumilaceae archaeon]NIU01401.1 hypothetical protein [Nitrosopumilaceae archaeon]NIU87759.1 hypothetical protein [Nitrosopumilaceae archaeon]NIV66137.1 hypothetical protein [Nitrosopumilaceae archaeon]NIX62003.1 hypothetical protein [Nitrosopumilaceae archaeon]
MSSKSNPASYLNKKSIYAIAGGSVAAAIILSVFLFYPDLSGDAKIPGSNVAENMDIPEIQSGQQSVPQSEEQSMPSAQSGENPIVAEVNGEGIHLNEVKEAQAVIQAQSGQQVQGTALLDQLVTKELLLQEADARDISITTQEAKSSLESQITQNGMTIDQFKQRLQQQGTSYEDTVSLYREQITIDALLKDAVSGTDVSVSESEAQSFFDENTDAIQNQFGEDTAYEDVSDAIKNTITQQKQQGLVTEFINELKSDAEIITYKDRL